MLVGWATEIWCWFLTVFHQAQLAKSRGEISRRVLLSDFFQIWDRQTLECVQVLTGHTGSVLCLQYDENNIISGSSDSTVRWETVDPGRVCLELGVVFEDSFATRVRETVNCCEINVLLWLLVGMRTLEAASICCPAQEFSAKKHSLSSVNLFCERTYMYQLLISFEPQWYCFLFIPKVNVLQSVECQNWRNAQHAHTSLWSGATFTVFRRNYGHLLKGTLAVSSVSEVSLLLTSIFLCCFVLVSSVSQQKLVLKWIALWQQTLKKRQNKK